MKKILEYILIRHCVLAVLVLAEKTLLKKSSTLSGNNKLHKCVRSSNRKGFRN